MKFNSVVLNINSTMKNYEQFFLLLLECWFYRPCYITPQLILIVLIEFWSRIQSNNFDTNWIQKCYDFLLFFDCVYKSSLCGHLSFAGTKNCIKTNTKKTKSLITLSNLTNTLNLENDIV